MREPTVGEILRETVQASGSPDAENVYDEVLREVSARIDDQGSIGKADIGAPPSRMTAPMIGPRPFRMPVEQRVQR